jgi:TPR repeat protein
MALWSCAEAPEEMACGRILPAGVIILSGILSGLLLLAANARAGEPSTPGGDPGSASPAAALQRLEQAMKVGDLNACAAAMADPVGPVMRQSFAAARKVGQVKRKLAAALDARFGPAGASPLAYAADDASQCEQLRRLTGMTITEQRPDGEQFNLIVSTTVRTPQGTQQIRQGFLAIPQAGRWKVSPMTQARNLHAQRVRLANAEKVAGAFEALAQAVAAGQYRSRPDAERAARLAYDQAMGINQPPKPGQDAFGRGKKLYLAKDMAGAFQLFLESARAGYAPAQLQVGWHYEFGEGAAQNSAEAVRWYRRAAEQGNRIAQCNLGNHYLDGTGVPRNSALAFQWFSRSAAQDYATAIFSIGRMYNFGEGVPESREQAIAWYRKAAALGDSQAAYFAHHLVRDPMNIVFRNEEEQSEYLRIMNLRHRGAIAEADAMMARRDGDHFESSKRAHDAAAYKARAEQLERDSKYRR